MVLTTLLINDIRDNAKTRFVTVMTHGAVGTDSTTPTASDTVLGAETFRDTIDFTDTSGTNTMIATLRVLTTENNGNNIAEFGTLDAASGGNLWTRNTMTAIVKTSDIQVFLDVQTTLSVTETT